MRIGVWPKYTTVFYEKKKSSLGHPIPSHPIPALCPLPGKKIRNSLIATIGSRGLFLKAASYQKFHVIVAQYLIFMFRKSSDTKLPLKTLICTKGELKIKIIYLCMANFILHNSISTDKNILLSQSGKNSRTVSFQGLEVG